MLSSFAPPTILLRVILLAVAIHCKVPDTCEVTNTTFFQQHCANVATRIQYTRFPNIHGQPQQSVAGQSLNTPEFVALMTSGCDIDVELFFCLFFFPTCRETAENVTVVQPPCRNFCLRVRNSCPQEFACSELPEFDPADPTACYDPYHLIVVNEVNAHSLSSPKFVEFWDFGMKATLLDSFTVAFFDGSGSLSRTFELTGNVTTQQGYFTIGEGSESDIAFSEVDSTSAIAIYRTNSIQNPFNPTANDLVDALAYSNENAPVAPSLSIFPNDITLFNVINTSISRCYSLRNLTIEAFDIKVVTQNAKNRCPQEEVEVVVENVLEKFTIQSEQFFSERCCFDTLLYCAFRKSDSTGYCTNRNQWKSGEVSVEYNIYERTETFCDLSSEVLAIAQSYWETNILTSNCEEAFSPEKKITLIVQNQTHVQYGSYGPLDEYPLIDFSTCQTFSENACLNILARLFVIDNDLVASDSTCDSTQNYAGYSIGFSCFGVPSFPCLGDNSVWRIIVSPLTNSYNALGLSVEVLSDDLSVFSCSTPNSSLCNTSSVTFLSADTVELTDFEKQNFSFIASVYVAAPSPFNFNERGVDLFEIAVIFNDKVKARIRPPIIEVTPPTKYVAVRLDISTGLYTIIDRFEIEQVSGSEEPGGK